MAVYPPKIRDRFREPRFAGRPAGCNGVGTSASFQCGCFARVRLRIEPREKVIAVAAYESNGCGFMIAAADAIAEQLAGSGLAELHSMDEEYLTEAVESELGTFPIDRRQCVHVVLEAVRAALADYRAFALEEFRGEKPLVCTCFGVTEDVIDVFIAANASASTDDVAAACRAGSGCGSCRMLIQEMLDARSGEPDMI